jgi:hypothetical protein
MLGAFTPAVEWLGAGALLVSLGYLVRFRGWTFLVAGYDDTASVPEDVAASVVGNAVLRLGVAALVLGVAYAVADPPAYVPLLFGAVAVFAVVRLVYRLRTNASAGAGRGT